MPKAKDEEGDGIRDRETMFGAGGVRNGTPHFSVGPCSGESLKLPCSADEFPLSICRSLQLERLIQQRLPVSFFKEVLSQKFDISASSRFIC